MTGVSAHNATLTRDCRKPFCTQEATSTAIRGRFRQLCKDHYEAECAAMKEIAVIGGNARWNGVEDALVTGSAHELRDAARRVTAAAAVLDAARASVVRAEERREKALGGFRAAFIDLGRRSGLLSGTVSDR